MQTRAAIAGFILAIVAGLAILKFLVLPGLLSLRSQPRLANTTALIRQVQTLSDLVTVKYVVEKVVVFEDVKWYGENRVLLVAHGIVKAGINVADLKPDDIQISEKSVTIRLPLPRVTDIYLDEQKTQVIEHSTGILRTFDKDLEQNARRRALDEIRLAARRDGIVKEADDRARQAISTIFRQAGFEKVEFRGYSPE